MAKFSKKEITRAVDEVDKSLEEFYHEKPGAPINDYLDRLSKSDRQYTKDLIAKTLNELFTSKHHKKD